jgi:hypothetical protein
MKALSLTQPWATLVAIGAKKLETRSWPTYYRGPLLIHAAKGFPGWARDTCFQLPFATAIAAAGYTSFSQLPLGQILGMVSLTGCKATHDLAPWVVDETERTFGDYGAGRFAWRLEEPVKFDEPIPCKGALGLWKVPDEIARQLEARFGEAVS